ncbi:MAG: DUF7260 family protein [Halobacteriota archaeon]
MQPNSVGTTFSIREDPSIATNCTGWECELSAMAFDPLVIATVVFLALTAFFAFAYISDARSCCRTERRIVSDERDAFEEFEHRVAGLTTVGTETSPGSTTGQVVGFNTSHVAASGGTGLADVIDAYRRTVMSLPHYDDEYNETVTQSLSEEFSHEAAVAVTSRSTLSPALKSTLVSQSRQARKIRAEFIDAIDEEMAALDDAESTLSRIDRNRRALLGHLDGIPPQFRFDAGYDVWHRLHELRTQCEHPIEERQSHLRNPPLQGGSYVPSFYEYLYDPIDDTSHPVLSAFLDLVGTIEDDIVTVEREFLANRRGPSSA